VPLGQVSSANNDKDILSISTETNRSIFGYNSLRVDVKPANTTNWSTISTDFIPVNENEYYNASLSISGKEVNQPHSKINYFDSNKEEIKSAFIFGGRMVHSKNRIIKLILLQLEQNTRTCRYWLKVIQK
jgi:hypothetical protein